MSVKHIVREPHDVPIHLLPLLAMASHVSVLTIKEDHLTVGLTTQLQVRLDQMTQIAFTRWQAEAGEGDVTLLRLQQQYAF